MTSEQFCYWLQGYSEITGKQPDEKQWAIIVEHLQTVFQKQTLLHNFPILEKEKYNLLNYPVTC